MRLTTLEGGPSIWTRVLAVVLGIVSPGTAFGQAKPDPFLLDTAKPYVYLTYDHISRQAPATLWLRIKNNCRYPIEVITHDPGTPDPQVTLNHDVIPILGPFSEPPPTEIPRGYNFHVGSVEVIKPGRDLLFTVPANHVTVWWSIEIRFELILPTSRSVSHPPGVVSYTWGELPLAVRKAGTDLP